MKNISIVVFVIILFINPVVDAHGANTFQFIMRNGSIQPDDAQVTQNDSIIFNNVVMDLERTCLLYTSPSPRDMRRSRMPSSA